ncbi:hypothetical protein BJX66DRAFT_333536 [Aspergillus keveii]|uniref:DUF7708 domain-containing protein n=1 Tax=Aspergillus keveii TaxID=714993 RepID=A0ABR4GIN1_9EURO
MAADYDQQIYQKPQVRRAVLAFMSGLDKDKQVSKVLSRAKTNCRYNIEKERWEPINVEALYLESNDARQKFLESMAQYDVVAKPKYKTNLSIRDAHSWDEVHRVIDASVDAYQVQATSGIWGRIRLGFRKFSNANGSCCAFLELIPSSSVFTATLCGALKLIFVAAHRIGNVRKEAMDALESFPDTLSKITATLSIFYESEDMHRRKSALYVSILDALEGILTWFKERAASKSVKAVWKQINYKEDLLERIETIETLVSGFNDTASRCAMSTLKDIDQRLALGRQEASDGFKDLSESTFFWHRLGHYKWKPLIVYIAGLD